MKSMPKSLARGFQTSQPTGNFLELASVEINRTVAEFDAIQRDQTMTRAQRSPALFKLRETAKSALGKQLSKARSELDTRFNNLDRQADEALKGKLTTVEISQLALQLKAMPIADRMATIQFSADHARAAALAPPALSGVDNAEAGLTTFLKYHEPLLLEQLDQLQADVSAVKSMERHVDSGLMALEMATDTKALETMYKPNLDAIDLEPRHGETVADYRKRVGDPLQDPATVSAE
jgi:hypothetical protein